MWRAALTAARWTTRRTAARPPRITRPPWRWPEASASGARPTSMAICLSSHAPSSLRRASRVAAATGPHAGDRADDGREAGEVLLGGDAPGDLGIERGDVLGEAGDAPAQVSPREGGLGAGALALERRQAGGEQRQHARVEPIRLRQHADRLGEEPGAQRARDRRGMAAGVQAAVRAARCHVPFSGTSIHWIDLRSASPSITVSSTSWVFNRRFSWRWPEAVLATRKGTPAGRM